jgi:hypothetical protein
LRWDFSLIKANIMKKKGRKPCYCREWRATEFYNGVMGSRKSGAQKKAATGYTGGSVGRLAGKG